MQATTVADVRSYDCTTIKHATVSCPPLTTSNSTPPYNETLNAPDDDLILLSFFDYDHHQHHQGGTVDLHKKQPAAIVATSTCAATRTRCISDSSLISKDTAVVTALNDERKFASPPPPPPTLTLGSSASTIMTPPGPGKHTLVLSTATGIVSPVSSSVVSSQSDQRIVSHAPSSSVLLDFHDHSKNSSPVVKHNNSNHLPPLPHVSGKQVVVQASKLHTSTTQQAATTSDHSAGIKRSSISGSAAAVAAKRSRITIESASGTSLCYHRQYGCSQEELEKDNKAKSSTGTTVVVPHPVSAGANISTERSGNVHFKLFTSQDQCPVNCVNYGV